MTLEEITRSENAKSFNASSRVITNPEEIKRYLDFLAIESERVVKEILEDQEVSNVGDPIYQMDIKKSFEILQERFPRTEQVEPGRIPYWDIFQTFQTKGDNILDIYIPIKKEFGLNPYEELKKPFSKMIETGRGCCFEHAVLTHLFAQRGKEQAYLIGGFTEKEKEPAESHAFNIIFRKQIPYLVDTTIPEIKLLKDSEGKTIQGYQQRITPILGLNKDNSRIYTKSFEDKLIYCLN